jgi:type II secretory pathway component PulF
MNLYRYKARSKFGKPVIGVMSADSKDAVASKLTQMGYLPIFVKETKEEASPSWLSAFSKISASDLNFFTRQFSVLQKAGLPILSSLAALKEQTLKRALKDIIVQLARDIESGSSLSDALNRYPKVFNALYVNMVKSGETAGILDQAFEKLADLGEHDEKIRSKIKSAMRYPIIVICALIIGFIVLTIFVLPRFAKIYEQFSTALPLPTQILLFINYAVTKFWWLTLVLVIIVSAVINKLINTKRGRYFWDGEKLKLPIFGELVLRLSMARFALITGTLIKSGIPILKVLELVEEGTGNVVISKVVENIRMNVAEGRGMAEPMKVSMMFPPVVVQMVAVGEETGKLDELLLNVCDYYEFQINYTIENLTSLIEPILILVLGCAVLFMALGIFLPMWNMMNLFVKR